MTEAPVEIGGVWKARASACVVLILQLHLPPAMRRCINRRIKAAFKRAIRWLQHYLFKFMHCRPRSKGDKWIRAAWGTRRLHYFKRINYTRKWNASAGVRRKSSLTADTPSESHHTCSRGHMQNAMCTYYYFALALAHMLARLPRAAEMFPRRRRFLLIYSEPRTCWVRIEKHLAWTQKISLPQCRFPLLMHLLDVLSHSM